jgi:hypothetical protein
LVPNWDAGALPGSVPVAGVDAARLPFGPNVPDGLGTPVRVVASDPAEYSGVDRAIAWVFDHPTYGLFVIQERIVPRAAVEAEWDELVGEAPGCRSVPATPEVQEGFGLDEGAAIEECSYGNRSFVTLDNGVRAFVLEGNVTTSLQWLEPVKDADEAALLAYRAEVGNPALELAVQVTVLGPVGELTKDEALEIANNT